MRRLLRVLRDEPNNHDHCVAADDPATDQAALVPRVEETRSAISDSMRSAGISSGQFALQRFDGSSVAFAVGEARPGVALTTSSEARLLCAGKPLLAIAFAQAVSDGDVSLATPLRELMPELTHVDRGVVVGDLLCHSARFGADPLAEALLPVKGRPETLKLLVDNAHCFKADRRRARYSIWTAWTLLEEAFRRATGVAFTEWGTSFARRAGLPSMRFGCAPADGVAVSWMETDSGLRPPGAFDCSVHSNAYVSAMGIRSSASDLARLYWLIATDQLPGPEVDVLRAMRCRHSAVEDGSIEWGYGFLLSVQSFAPRFSSSSFGHFAEAAAGLVDPRAEVSVAITLSRHGDWRERRQLVGELCQAMLALSQEETSYATV